MDLAGPAGFWMFVAAMFACVLLYALWRMTRRPAIPVGETGSYVAVSPVSSAYAAGVAQEVAAGSEA